MTESQREAEVQDSLAEMRTKIAEHPVTDDRLAPARHLIEALKRRGLRVVSDDEWDENFEKGFEEGGSTSSPEAEIVNEALMPLW